MEKFSPALFGSVCEVDQLRVSSLRDELDESTRCRRATARYAVERSRGPGRKTLGAALLVVPAVQSRNAPVRDGAQGTWPLRVARPGCPPTSRGITRPTRLKTGLGSARARRRRAARPLPDWPASPRRCR